MNRAALAFYGDDFTGSSENFAQACRGGLTGRLFFETTDPARVLHAARGLDVVGIAGTSRAQSPQEMAQSLPPAFAALAAVGARLVQYKVCSTFDSAPGIGNFATVLEIARRYWPDAIVPVLPATPSFGRHTAFSNHFSRHQGEILRLDRNPALVDHPSTPMREADLRRHLMALGCPQVAAIHLPELMRPDDALAALIAERGASGTPVVLDTVTEDELFHAASAIWRLSATSSVFALAAQGLAHGIGRAASAARPPQPAAESSCAILPAVDRLLVISGSCAVQTGRQLAAAEAAGWCMVEIPAAAVRSEAAAHGVAEQLGATIDAALVAGRSVAAYTARGAATLPPDAARTRALGALMADLFRRAVRSGVRRVCFSGGDSSSYAMTHSGADALDLAHFDAAQSCHVFRLAARDEIDGTEVLLKGGQVGADTFFLDARGRR
ncbi:MAG: four-carbon acid sugar kinase family protein [Hyphomicrobiaceae bacterium]